MLSTHIQLLAGNLSYSPFSLNYQCNSGHLAWNYSENTAQPDWELVCKRQIIKTRKFRTLNACLVTEISSNQILLYSFGLSFDASNVFQLRHGLIRIRHWLKHSYPLFLISIIWGESSFTGKPIKHRYYLRCRFLFNGDPYYKIDQHLS